MAYNQPASKAQALLTELAGFPKGKYLSEFQLRRFLNQADSIINVDAASAWHLKAVAYYYANEIEHMSYCFKTSLNLNYNSTVLNNYMACSINHGCLPEVFDLFKNNTVFFVQDRELILKITKLILNLYDKDMFNEFYKILENNEEIINDKNFIKEIQDCFSDVERIILDPIKMSWKDANLISKTSLDFVRSNKLRTDSIVRVQLTDENEIVNDLNVYGTPERIHTLNSDLFDFIYDHNLLNLWNKIYYVFSVANEAEETSKA
ncbi:hypothetical protein RGH81_000831 [Acinetobacter nosocomialis]|nr:hypothetical protein [Acinetobacter nosocomialis]